MLSTIITFVIVFSILVVFHEFGHYFFAKRAGILVREFAVGFGPKIFSYRKNGTTFTIRILPIGGYVRMAGFEEEPDIRPGMPLGIVLDEKNKIKTINLFQKKQLLEAVPLEVLSFDLEREMFIEGYLAGNEQETVRYDVNRDAMIIEEDGTEVQVAPIEKQFQSASLPNRMITNFAGPMNNIILAIAVFALMAFLQGGVPSQESRLGEIMPDSPAEQAGLAQGDLIVQIDEQEIDNWNQMVLIIQENPEIPLEFMVQNQEDEQEVQVTVIPSVSETADGTEIGQIGVQRSIDTSFMGKLTFGFTQTWTLIAQIFTVLGSIFTQGFSVDMFGGPVAIYATTETVVESGFFGVLNWLALLSINLGIINLLPIPALDGGKLLLNMIEGVRGKPLSQEKEGIITLIGVGLLLFLMILVTWNDIQTYFFN